MHAKLLVPIYLKLFQTMGLQKLSEFVDQQGFLFSTWLSLGNFLQRNFKSFEQCLAIAFSKFFINPSLIYNSALKLY